jgi:hypothetical protein
MQSRPLVILTAAIVAISAPVYAQGGGGSGGGSLSGGGPSGSGVGSAGTGPGRAGGAAVNSGNIGTGNVNSVTAAPSSSTGSPSYGQSPSGAAATKSLSSTNTGVMVNPNAARPSSANSGASVAPAGRIGDKMPSRDAK